MKNAKKNYLPILYACMGTIVMGVVTFYPLLLFLIASNVGTNAVYILVVSFIAYFIALFLLFIFLTMVIRFIIQRHSHDLELMKNSILLRTYKKGKIVFEPLDVYSYCMKNNRIQERTRGIRVSNRFIFFEFEPDCPLHYFDDWYADRCSTEVIRMKGTRYTITDITVSTF